MSDAVKPVTIATDRKLDSWEQFFIDALEAVGELKSESKAGIDAIAQATLMEDGNVLTAFHNANSMQLAYCAVNLMFDAVQRHIIENAEYYRDIILDAGDCEDAEGDEE